jgi:hypothetical protein
VGSSAFFSYLKLDSTSLINRVRELEKQLDYYTIVDQLGFYFSDTLRFGEELIYKAGDSVFSLSGLLSDLFKYGMSFKEIDKIFRRNGIKATVQTSGANLRVGY